MTTGTISYLADLRGNWRAVAAAAFGMSSGIMIIAYVLSIMGPHLIRDLGWSKAQLAVTGTFALITFVGVPVIGRIGDMIGTRRTAAAGVVVFPLCYLAFSQMETFGTYLLVLAALFVVAGTTTPVIYARAVVQHLTRARGLGLALAASGAPVAGLIGVPLLSAFVADHGWRAGYLAVAAFSLSTGVIALLLMPPDAPAAKAARTAARPGTVAVYGRIFGLRTTWLILGAMLLCHVHHTVFLPQMGLILAEQGISAAGAAAMVSTYAFGTLAGRIICGLALDRFAPVPVTVTTMAVSAAGLIMIAGGSDAVPFLWFAVLCIGLSFGAEADIAAYLITRYYGLDVYSTVFGLVSAAISTGCAIGSALAALLVHRTGGYEAFLWTSGACVGVGSLLFLFLPPGSGGRRIEAPEPEGSVLAAAAAA